MSTPAPPLVITTPTEVGGALSMLSEAASDRSVLSVPQRRARALYPKLRPGPQRSAQQSVASHQRARLYGAMIELVASRGYAATTVAELCGLAGVSKRTLYERFPGGKQDCFLATYDIIVRRAEVHVLAAGRRGSDGSTRPGQLKRLLAVVEALACEVARYPNAARLVLVEAFDTGRATIAHLERTTRQAQRLVSWSLLGGDAPVPSPLLVHSIVADGTRLVRGHLFRNQAVELALLKAELSDLCSAALTPSPAVSIRTPPVRGARTATTRDRNRPLHSNELTG
jgi:AcrR family transcriptional regulator